MARLSSQFDHVQQLKEAVESPTGQLPLFVQAQDLKGAAKVLEGDRQLTDRLPTDTPEMGQTLGYDERNRYQTDDEVWEHKLWEASHSIYGDDEPLRSDIRENGLQRPVRIAGGEAWARTNKTPFQPGTVLNGHHRLAVMSTDRPESWMQVDWDHGPTVGGSRGDSK